MRYLLMLVASLVAGPLWAGEFLSDSGRAPKTQPLLSPLGGAHTFTLTPTYSLRPSALASVRDLVRDLDRPRVEGMLASTTWLKGALSTDAELAMNQGEANGLAASSPGDSRIESAARMMRLGFTATAGAVRYGVRYRHAGEAFEQVGDQALKEAWGEWKRGSLTLSSVFGQQWNNVAADPMRTRVEQRYGRIGVAWNRPSWPTFAVTVAQKASAGLLVGGVAQKSRDHAVEASLAYAGRRWQVRLVSGYTLQTDGLRPGTRTCVKTESLTAAFQPFTTLTIAPSLGYRSERQEWTGVRVDSPSVSVTMNYRQSQRLLISAMASYAGMRSSDGLIDVDTVGGKGMLAWDVQRRAHWTTLISFEAGFTRHVDHVPPSTQPDDLSGIVRVVVVPL